MQTPAWQKLGLQQVMPNKPGQLLPNQRHSCFSLIASFGFSTIKITFNPIIRLLIMGDRTDKENSSRILTYRLLRQRRRRRKQRRQRFSFVSWRIN